MASGACSKSGDVLLRFIPSFGFCPKKRAGDCKHASFRLLFLMPAFALHTGVVYHRKWVAVPHRTGHRVRLRPALPGVHPQVFWRASVLYPHIVQRAAVQCRDKRYDQDNASTHSAQGQPMHGSRLNAAISLVVDRLVGRGPEIQIDPPRQGESGALRHEDRHHILTPSCRSSPPVLHVAPVAGRQAVEPLRRHAECSVFYSQWIEDTLRYSSAVSPSVGLHRRPGYACQMSS